MISLQWEMKECDDLGWRLAYLHGEPVLALSWKTSLTWASGLSSG